MLDEVVQCFEHVAMSHVIFPKETAQNDRIQGIARKTFGREKQVKRIANGDGRANACVGTLLAKVLDQNIAAQGVSGGIEGGTRTKLMNMLDGQIHVVGEACRVAHRGRELEANKTTIDHDDGLEANVTGGGHDVAHVGALGAAGQPGRDEERRRVLRQVCDQPI